MEWLIKLDTPALCLYCVLCHLNHGLRAPSMHTQRGNHQLAHCLQGCRCTHGSLRQSHPSCTASEPVSCSIQTNHRRERMQPGWGHTHARGHVSPQLPPQDSNTGSTAFPGQGRAGLTVGREVETAAQHRHQSWRPKVWNGPRRCFIGSVWAVMNKQLPLQ